MGNFSLFIIAVKFMSDMQFSESLINDTIKVFSVSNDSS